MPWRTSRAQSATQDTSDVVARVTVMLAAIVAIAIGVRTVNKAPAVDAQLTIDTPLRESAAIGTRERTVAVLPFDSISADAAMLIWRKVCRR